MHPISVPSFTVPSTPVGAALAPSASASSAEPLQQRSLSKETDGSTAATAAGGGGGGQQTAAQAVAAAAGGAAAPLAVHPSSHPYGHAQSSPHLALHPQPSSGYADEAAAAAAAPASQSSSSASASTAAANGSLPASQSSGALHAVGSAPQSVQPLQAGSGSSTAASSAPLPPFSSSSSWSSFSHLKQPSQQLPQLTHATPASGSISVPSTPRAAAGGAALLPAAASSSSAAAAAASSSSSSLPSSSTLSLPASAGNAAAAVHASAGAPPLSFGSLPLPSPSSVSSSSSSSYAALLDGLSESEESGEDGLAGMRMIEEEDEDDDSVDEARRGLGGSGGPSLADGSRRQQISQRGYRRRADDDEELERISSLSRPRAAFPPSALYPAVYQHSFLPQTASSSLLYPPQHPASFVVQPTFAPLAPYQGGYAQQQQEAVSHQQQLALAASGGVSHDAQSASSASPLLLSFPISLRGVRAFLFLCLLVNAGSLLVRDASLASFCLFLLLSNAVLALCVLTGKPFALAVLVQTEPAVSAGSRLAEPQQKATGSSAAANAAQPPAAPAARQSGGGRQSGISAAGSAVGGQPVSSPPPAPAAVSPLAAATRLLPAPLQTSASANEAAVAVSSAPPQQAGLPTLPDLPAVSDALPAAAAPLSASVSAAVSSPPPSRSPSPSPASAAVSVSAAASPSPFSSPSPQFEYANWSVSPLPLFTRGFRHKVPAGCSTRYSDKPQLASWCRTAGESFMVRQGPAYRKTKAKSASAPSLYECVGVDIFQSDSKIDHIARLLRLPLPPERLRRREPLHHDDKRRKAAAVLAAAAAAAAASQSQAAAAGDGSAASAASPDPTVSALLSEYPDGEFEDGSDSADGEYVPDADDAAVGVPPLWLVNFQIPAYAPPMPMWGKKEDGEGYSVVLYYRLTEQARDDLRHNTTPAARLLKSFTAGVGEERWHGRYKSIPRIVNPDECEVGRTVRSLIQSYNAKPFLTGPWCHSFLKGPGYVECFPERDTRVLTDAGLQFYGEIEARMAAGERVLFACYDRASRTLQYRPGVLVPQPPGAHQRLLQFTSRNSGARCVDDSDGVDAEAESGQHCSLDASLRVTGSHRMLVQDCSTASVSERLRRGGACGRASEFRKQAAAELLGRPCSCPAAVVQCRHPQPCRRCPAPVPLCEHRKQHVRMLAVAEAGHDGNGAASVRERLRLSPAQFDAFLELLGFWLQDGSLGEAGDAAVLFGQRRRSDHQWLREAFRLSGLVSSALSCSRHAALGIEVCRVTDRAWFDFFDDEFGASYPGSRHHDAASLGVDRQSSHSAASPAQHSGEDADRQGAVPSHHSASLSPASVSRCLPEHPGDDDEPVREEECGPPDGDSDSSECGRGHDCTEPEHEEPWWEPDDAFNPVKWCPTWVLRCLTREQSRLVLRGLWRADRSWARLQRRLCLRGSRLRDQLVQLLLHCGYSPTARLAAPAGQLLGYRGRSDRLVYTVQQVDALRDDGWTEEALLQRFRPMRAAAEYWSLDWATLEDEAGRAGCLPRFQRQSGIVEQPYDAARDGRIWCVSVQHCDHLIVAQRAERCAAGTGVQRLWRPLLVGQCDIDVHRFRFVARKGAHAFLESLKSMVIDIAFVVEGQDDEELPEQIQGATRIHFPSPQDAQNITHYLKLYNSRQ